MIVYVAIADGKIAGTNRQVDESVPVFFVSLVLTIDITMVYPDVMRVASSNSIRISMMDDKVADDDVLLAIYVQPNARQFGTLHTNNRLVAVHRDKVLGATESLAFHFALHDNNIGCSRASIGCQVCTVSHTDYVTTHTTCNAVDAVVIVDKSHRAILCLNRCN